MACNCKSVSQIYREQKERIEREKKEKEAKETAKVADNKKNEIETTVN